MTERSPIRVGISACLVGQPVRYDGGHKRDSSLLDWLGRFAELVPVCPEVELGLGTPRETLRLELRGGEVRMVFAETREDITERMRDWSARRVERLAREDLSGFVLKKSSPSCGLHRVKVYGDAEAPTASGRGLFAQALHERFHALPIEEEGHLEDAEMREDFLERVYAYREIRLRDRR